jgi:exosortase
MSKRLDAAAAHGLPPLRDALSAPLGIRFGLGAREGLFLLLAAASALWAWGPLATVIGRSLSGTHTDHYSHIVLLPGLTAYLLYTTRDSIRAYARPWASVGIAAMALGALTVWVAPAVSIVSRPENRLSLAMLGLIVMWVGGFLSCYGPRALRAATLPFLVLAFMVPLPPAALDAVIVFLQKGSTEATAVVFSLIGMPAFREGFLFALPGLSIEVAKECSGIRSSLALMISGLAMAHLLLRRVWTRALFLFLIVPLAIVKNAFRIVLLSWLGVYVDRTFITGSTLHSSGGIPIFVASLGVLGAMVWLLRRHEPRVA